MIQLKNISRFKIILYITLVVLLIFSIVINSFNNHSKYLGNEEYITGYVKNIKVKRSKIELRVVGLEEVIVNLYVDTKVELNEFLSNFNLGDLVLVKGNLTQPKINTNFNMFNYKEYLRRNNIYYIIVSDNIEVIEKNTNILYKIKQSIINRINNYKYSKEYLHSFILGDTNYILDEINDDYRKIGISHLFAISGMHIGLIILLLSKLLNRLNKYLKFILITIFLIMYLFLIDFSITAIRACLFSLIICINKNCKLNLSSIEVVIIVFLLISIFNPNNIFNMGFQISIIVSFFLVLFSNKINSNRNKIIKLFKVSYISFISTLPIMIYYFSTINIISVFVNIIFVPLVSYILFPLCIITLIFKIFDPILFELFNIFNMFVSFFSNISILEFSFAKPHVFICIIYYLILIITYKFPKVITIYIIMLIIHYNIIYFNDNAYIYMFDVGQGDSILIMLPHNEGNILIDTGGKTSYCKSELGCSSYSLGEELIIPSLKKLGIKRLDYLILSHGDFDHMGESINLVNNYKVDKVIFNSNDYNDLELELIKVLEAKNIEYYNDVEQLDIDNNKLYFLNTGLYNNENDNSNIIYTEFNNTKLLFMGDAGVDTEKNIVSKYNIKNIDILKVGHHGSNTSTSKKFIDVINPKESIISVGKNNRYHHPKSEVLETLESSKVYRTDLDGSIQIILNKNGYTTKTCRQ